MDEGMFVIEYNGTLVKPCEFTRKRLEEELLKCLASEDIKKEKEECDRVWQQISGNLEKETLKQLRQCCKNLDKLDNQMVIKAIDKPHCVNNNV